jgi:sugar phosphate isomerase/epimerase
VKLASPGAPHLTYCTNIHPGETWPEVRANLERHVLAVRGRVAPGRRFGIGLRLSAAAADALAAVDGALDELRAFLAAHDCYVFSINGFPYGAFHGTRVKEAVYAPDWREDARVAYTDRLADLLAALLPADVSYGSVSTVPGAFRARAPSDTEQAEIAERLLRHVAHLAALEARTGRWIKTALEPEPWCVLETVADAIAFFDRRLFTPAAAERLAALTGGTPAAAESAIRRHLGVCFDACHMAIEFEDPSAALDRLAAANVAVVKVQISAGMAATIGGGDDATRAALAGFADDVYLHQVVERGPDGIRRFLDLPAALAARPATADPREWRVHFHVPLFREALGPVRSTQPWVAALLRALRARAYDGHLEVETYTWDVLPASFRGEPVDEAVARELAWVLERLES